MGLFDSTHEQIVRQKLFPVSSEIRSINAMHEQGIGDKTPLDARLSDDATWKGTDDDTALMRWRIKIKSWFAFSDRSPKGIALSFVYFPLLHALPLTIWFTGWSWWYLLPIGVIPVARKWRSVPTVIFAAKGKGWWRLESNVAQCAVPMATPPTMFFPRIESSAASIMAKFYLSRVQYWCRWHVAIHWPLLVTFHWWRYAEDVPQPKEEPTLKGTEISFYRGWHFDADGIFWGDGTAGPNFK